jgi:adenylate kinase family enzyme
MNDLEHWMMTALVGEWLDDEDDWDTDYFPSPIDQIQAIERLGEAMNPLRPACDEL